MSKSIVVYFSASGVTKKYATLLANHLNTKAYEIIPEVAYTSADLNWQDSQSRTTKEKNDINCRPKFKLMTIDLNDVDTIYLGFPIWWYTCPRIINSWLESVNTDGKKIIVWTTSGGSQTDCCLDGVKSSAKNANVVLGVNATSVSQDKFLNMK